MSIIRERGKGKIDPAKSTMQGLGNVSQFYAMLFNFPDEIVSSFIKTLRVLECLNCQVCRLSGNRKFVLIAIMIGGWKERGTGFHICQRSKLQIGESIWLEGCALDDDIRTSPDGSRVNPSYF